MTPAKSPTRRRLISLAGTAALAGVLSLPAVAQPQPERSYAVLSLAVDSITLVAPRIQTGSSIDRNIHTVVATPDDSMDIVAVQAAEVAIKTAERKALVELYVTRDPKIYAQARENSPVDDAPAVIGMLQAILAQSKATHLVLITKDRSEARFQLHKSKTGMGKMFGVGFYNDEHMPLQDSETGANLQGFVAPFACLKIQLIELASRKTVNQALSQASRVYAGTVDAASAWKTMTDTKKAQALEDMIREAVTEGVTKVLARS